MISSYVCIVKKYAVFEGRESRRTFWFFVLANLILGLIINFLDTVLDTGDVLAIVYSLALFLPGIGASIRRLHDIDKTGWWVLISLVPIVGGIWLLVLQATAGTPGENKYGEPVINEM